MASPTQLARAKHSPSAGVSADAPTVYRVVAGDNLERIARSFETSVQTLIGANPRLRSHPDTLPVGIVLNIPNKSHLYDVQPGDTLAGVAKRLGVTQDDLAQFNATAPAKGQLRVGTHLQIPPPHAAGALSPAVSVPMAPAAATVSLPSQPPAEDWPAAKPKRVGPTSYTVELVQRALNRLGYSVADDAGLGKGTNAAVRAFQKANKLRQSGVVDQATWKALRAQSAVAHVNATFAVSRADLADDVTLQNAYDVIATLAYEDPQLLRRLMIEVGAIQVATKGEVTIDRQACWALAQRCQAMGIPLTQTTLDFMNAFDHDQTGLRGYDEARSIADFIVQDMPAAHRINTDTYDEMLRTATAHSNDRHPLVKMPSELPKTVVAIESSFNPKAGSKAGAGGLMQLMPAAAKAYGVKNRFDPAQNVLGGTTMIGDLYAASNGSAAEAFAKYNSGGTDYRILETRNYIRRAQTIYAYYRVTDPLASPVQSVDPATMAPAVTDPIPVDPDIESAKGKLTQSFAPGDSK